MFDLCGIQFPFSKICIELHIFNPLYSFHESLETQDHLGAMVLVILLYTFYLINDSNNITPIRGENINLFWTLFHHGGLFNVSSVLACCDRLVQQHALTIFAFIERGQTLCGLQRQLLHLMGHRLALGTGQQQT